MDHRSKSWLRGALPVLLAWAGIAHGAVQRTLTGTVRDFNGAFSSTAPYPATAGGHPHFEIFTFNNIFDSRIPSGFNILPLNGQIYATEPNIVTATLGADHKPVWLGGDGSNPNAPFHTTKVKVSGNNLVPETDDNVSRTLFNQWFNDVPGVNLKTTIPIPLEDTLGNGIYTYINHNFFPIDGQLLGNEGRLHNQHFTMEIHDTFTYQPGQAFHFFGDDDVWVYINNQRVIDLGGVHQAVAGDVNLDTLGLTPGQTYPFDFFFTERNTFGSEFQIQTSIPLGAVPEPQGAGIGMVLAALVWTEALRRNRLSL